MKTDKFYSKFNIWNSLYIYVVSIIGVKISPNIFDKLDNSVPTKLDFVPFSIFKKTDFNILVLHCNQDE